jgi:hypothetical protein
MAGLFKLRVGDWRVVYEIWKDVIVIKAVGHRREIYSCEKLAHMYSFQTGNANPLIFLFPKWQRIMKQAGNVFQLTEEEAESLRSHFATLKSGGNCIINLLCLAFSFRSKCPASQAFSRQPKHLPFGCVSTWGILQIYY